MLAAGHDEDKDKARIGTPMERLMMMVSWSLLRGVEPVWRELQCGKCRAS